MTNTGNLSEEELYNVTPSPVVLHSMKVKIKAVGKYYLLYSLITAIVSSLAVAFIPMDILKQVAFYAGISLLVFIILNIIVTAIFGTTTLSALPMGVLISAVMGVIVGSSVKMVFLVGVTMFSPSVVTGGLIGVLMVTAVYFTLTAYIGLKTKRNLESWHMPLIFALIGYIILTLIVVFTIGVNPIVMIVLAVTSLAIFGLFNVVEANMIRHMTLSEESASWLALNLYLNFINMFQDFLEIGVALVFEFISGS